MDHYSKIKEFSEQILEELGSSYKEHIYVNAMCVHLRSKYLFQTEVIVPINYMGVQLGYERADIVIYEPIKCILNLRHKLKYFKKRNWTINKVQKNLNSNDGILINLEIQMEN